MQVFKPKHSPTGPAFKVTALFAFFIIGTFLLLNASTNFVFFYAEAYTKISLILVVLFAPALLYWFKRYPHLVAQLESKYPTNWIRNWIMQPFVAALLVAVVCMGPLGWLLTVSEVTTDTMKVMRAKAVEVGAYSAGKGCDQVARLDFDDVVKQVCLENMYPPGTMKVGQLLDVTVQSFPFGFLLISMADAAVEAPQTAVNPKDAHENY